MHIIKIELIKEIYFKNLCSISFKIFCLVKTEHDKFNIVKHDTQFSSFFI